MLLILGIILIEIIFGFWFKNSNYSNLLIPRQQTNIIDNFPYEHDMLGIYSRDKYGFRANNYELKNIDILILGGSTTEERDVDDNKIWTKIFELNLKKKYKVLNAGIGGQTSFGHKSMFEMWFKKLSNLKPKFIIVYLGINDALFLVENIGNIKISSNGRQINSSNRDTLVNIRKFDRMLQYIKNNSVFHHLYLIIKGNIISNKYKISYNTKPTIFKAFNKKAPGNIKNLDNDTLKAFKEYYYQNLNEIVQYSKNYNAKVVFITQVVSNNYWLKDFLSTINLLTLNFCEQKKIMCINLENEKLKLEEKHFYDGIHTTPEGSKIIGEFISSNFEKIHFIN